MFDLIKRMVAKYRKWKREKDIVQLCGNICYCPNCKDPLNDRATWLGEEDGRPRWRCSVCGAYSSWDFDSAPVPLLKEWGHQG